MMVPELRVFFTEVSETETGAHTSVCARAAAPHAVGTFEAAVGLDVDLAQIVLRAGRKPEKRERGKQAAEKKLFHKASSEHHIEDGEQRKPHFSRQPRAAHLLELGENARKKRRMT